ncbi:MAG: SusC/RagA family TonB-linked outer membrane protein [Fulvivirga sp.]
MKFNIYTNLRVACCLLLGCSIVNAQDINSVSAEKTAVDSDTIVAAYNRLPARSVTSSISTINSGDLENNSVFSLNNALYGKIPGLIVLQRESTPGNDLPQIFLRGRSTTAGNSPLILVDGIERNIEDVQLEDVESISVLKDASATVLYGIKGANGIILITTKRGSGDLRVDVKVEQGVQAPTRFPKFVNSASYAKRYNQALLSDGLASLFTDEDIAGYEAGDSYFYPNVDWAAETMKNFASSTKAHVAVSGGDETAKYYVSLGYYNNGGIFKNTNMNDGYSTNFDIDNVSFRSNLDINLSKNWSVNLDLAGRVYQRNKPIPAAATIFEVIYKYPAHLYPAYVQDGVYGGTSIYPNNPIGYINSQGYKKINNRVLTATLSTKYDFSDHIKGFSVGFRYASDNLYENEEGYQKDFLVRELLGKDLSGEPILSSAIGQNSPLDPFGPNGDRQSKQATFEAHIEYAPELDGNHDLNTMVIYHQDRLVVGNESAYNYQFLSGRINYSYLNRFFAEFGMSYSGTEAFPEGNRFGLFPAVSAGWIISEQSFLKGSEAIDFLKLRVSAGAVGNDAVGERFSDRRQYISNDGYRFGSANANQSGLYAGVLENFDFTWETAYKYDVGVDLRLFNNLDLGLTYFFQKRKDILISESALVPGIFGGDLPTVNAGISHNQGFEGRLFYAKQNKSWGYHVGINATYVKDELVYFPEAAKPDDYLYREGHPINQPFILEAIGFFSSEDDIDNSPVQVFGPIQPGDIKYKDQNNDGRIDDFDRKPLKNSTLPNWDFGLDLSFNYRNFDISAFFQGQTGRSIYLGSAPFIFWPLQNNSARISTYPEQFWTEETKNTADYPRLTTIDNQNNYRPSTQWYVNGNFLRLRSLNIGYTLPQNVVERVKLSSARIFLRGMNLFSLDHLKYTDPESQSGYPVMKSYNVGINLQF